MNSRLFAVILFALAASAPAENASTQPGNAVAPLDAKAWLRTYIAAPLSEYGWRTAPVFTWIMGYDFKDRQWKLNEYTNQIAHIGIGGAVTRLTGRQVTLCLACCIELQQYLGHDHHDPKLLDRIRDIAFYLVF